MTPGQISSGLDLTYASSTITTQQPTERELDLLFEAMYDDYIGGQPSAAIRTAQAAQALQVPQTLTATTTTANTAPTPTNSSSQAENIPNTSQDVDELETQQHVQQQENQAPLQPEIVVDNVPNDMLDGNTIMEPSNVKEAMKDPAWIDSMQEELLQFKQLDVWVLVPLTLMEIKDKLDLDKNGTLVDATKYCSMIGDLMYLMSSRPDIVHVTCLCARYQAKPTEKHLKEVKSKKKSFSGISDPSPILIRSCDSDLVTRKMILDVDYAGCKDTFKSTSGGAQFLGEKLVSWSSKKQDYTALSTAEKEYVSLSTCCAQVIWMRTQLTDYGFHFNKILIYCDLKSAITISCNPVQHSRTKHIAVHHHFIKEHVEKGTIELYFVKNDYQLADLFTKALLVDRFNYLVRRLDMHSLSPQELERLAKSQ
ncbi:hypothetical protein Tco_0648382 [Tanacetum coccineum]